MDEWKSRRDSQPRGRCAMPGADERKAFMSWLQASSDDGPTRGALNPIICYVHTCQMTPLHMIYYNVQYFRAPAKMLIFFKFSFVCVVKFFILSELFLSLFTLVVQKSIFSGGL